MLEYQGAFLIALVLALVVFLRVGVHIFARAKTKKRIREERQYHVFTTANDVVCSGRELNSVLKESGNLVAAPQVIDPPDPAARRAQFAAAREAAADFLSNKANLTLPKHSILILLDQSGSMAERMPRIAGEINALAEWLEANGADVMFAGFTTVGWHGGKSRKQYRRKWFRQPMPGRLCDLLHVIYSVWGSPVQQSDFEPLLEPAVFFENIDGEALLWARDQFPLRDDRRKMLLLISDGAPVDDSTILANDDDFLPDHLHTVAKDIEADNDIAIGGIGLEYPLDDVFAHHRQVAEDEAMIGAAVELIEVLSTRPHEPRASAADSLQ